MFNILAVGTTDDGQEFRREEVATTFVAPAAAPKTITLKQPNGGEQWNVGSSQLITWDRDTNQGRVRIDLSTDSGASWWDLTSGMFTENDGEYSYVPTPDDVSDNCLLKIVSVENPNVFDQSDAEYSISGTGNESEYFAYKISDSLPVPTICNGCDGCANEKFQGGMSL